MTPEEIRKYVVLTASALDGLRADSQQFLDLIAPGEEPAQARAMATMSSCGLTVAGIWREAGLRDSRLAPPYKIGTGISRLVSIAKEFDAWIPFRTDLLPMPGDMVLIGDNKQGGAEHVYTVIDLVEGTQYLFNTIDGGQVESKLQCIKAKKHRWTGNKDKGFAASDPGSSTVGGRVIVGICDVTRLPFTDNPY